MTKPPKDQAARDRIRTELGRSLLVEAGAGSGKTHQLAARMAAGVAEGKYEIEHIAAVTFTRKAAAELRGRFQIALEDELTNAGKDDARARRVRDALSKLERFFAGTIHAFCARLLRERPVEAGVAPGFTELDETEDAIVRQQAWRDYRAQAKAAGDTGYLELLDAGLEPKHFEQAFARVCQYEEVDFPPGEAEAPDTVAAWKALQKFWKDLQALLPNPIDTKCKTQERAERFAESWRFATRGDRSDTQLLRLLEIWKSQPDARLMSWIPKENGKKAKAIHDALRASVILPYLDRWYQYVYRLTITLLVEARKRAKADRVRRSSLTFNDLLLGAADLLRTNDDVRRSLQQKYRWLFVDEFQDTDPIQAEIMFLLAGDRPGSLFVVGDPKQSIFRFRRADIDIYNDVRSRLAGKKDEGLVRLTTNFRSVPALCEWANDVFKTKFPKTPTPQAPQFAPLDAFRDADGKKPSLIVLTTPDVGPNPGDDDEDKLGARVAAAEAERIARYIRDQIDRHGRKAGDFLILTRKKKSLRPYARALEALQVPIEVSGAGAFGESEEVRALALLITALSDPQDPVALVGVLRGPLFGASDQDLFAFRQTGGYFGISSEVTAPGTEVVSNALASLRRWHDWTRKLPAGAALDRILEDSGFLALAATSPGGVEAGDLMHAVDRVRAVLESGLTLADAADALLAWSGLDEDGPEESSEVDSLPLQPGRPEVVRLMNLHKAKGLEASVVFLADPLGGWKPTAEVRIVRKDGSSAVGYFQIKKDNKDRWKQKMLAAPAGWDAYAAEEQLYLDAEGHRLLYVAATRAKDMVVVSRYAGKSRGTLAWAELDAHLAGAPELKIPSAAAPPAAEKMDLSGKSLAASVASADAAHARARQASWTAVSVTAEAKALPRMTPGADDGAADDPTRVVTEDTPSRRSDAGTAWGTLIHGLLEHAMRYKTVAPDDLRRLAMWLTVDEPGLRVVLDEAVATVLAVSKQEFWAEAKASPECHEEAPFAVVAVDDDAARRKVVNGTIDCVFRQAAGWRLLDYKTAIDPTTEVLQRQYAQQVAAYAATWRTFVSGEVTGDTIVARLAP
jgi:ATP-dependent helicase/nuclease subunit A